MQVFTIIPPKFMWFQDTQSGNVFAWIWGVFALILVVFLIAWLAARSRKAKEEKLDEIARSQIDSPISGTIPQTGVVTTAPGEEIVVGNQVISAPPDDLADTVELHREGDDLTLIEGIGPALQEILNEAGIKSYEKLAQSDPALLQHMLMDVGLDYIDPSTWPEQARLALEGRYDELDEVKRKQRGD